MSEGEMQQAELPLEPCDGTKLLLQRMESHPEEFTEPYGKWSHMITTLQKRMEGHPNAEPWMSQQEASMLWNKYCEIKRREFHDHVMTKILNGTEEDSLSKQLRDAQLIRNQPLVVKNTIGYPLNAAQNATTATRVSSHATDAGTYFGPVKKFLGLE